MNIKDIIEDIKYVYMSLEEVRQDVQIKKHELELAQNSLKVLESAYKLLMQELDDEIRKGDNNIELIDPIEMEGCVITTRKSSPAVIINDTKSIPEQFIVNKPQVDKKAIKEALESGEKVEGASMREVTYNLKVSINE